MSNRTAIPPLDLDAVGHRYDLLAIRIGSHFLSRVPLDEQSLWAHMGEYAALLAIVRALVDAGNGLRPEWASLDETDKDGAPSWPCACYPPRMMDGEHTANCAALRKALALVRLKEQT